MSEWGPGEIFKPFDTGYLGKAGDPTTAYELGFGENPHSRQDNNIYARMPDGTIHDFDGHRFQVRVELQTRNYLKESHYSGDEIRKGGSCKIWINGVLCEDFFFRDPEQALLTARQKLANLCEASWAPWMQDCSGRLIYYRDTPAVVDRVLESGELMIRPAEGHFPPPAHVLESARVEGSDYAIKCWLDDYGDRMRVSWDDPQIWWWREETK